MKRRIALLDAARGDPYTARNFRRVLDGDVQRFSVRNREFPEAGAFDAVVVSGSEASVYWEDPWIDETREWLRGALDRGRPALGICWGHQLLADVLGGTVEPMGEYELGYRTVSHDGDDLFADVSKEFTVFISHSDVVTDLPAGAEQIAANEYGIHGFRHGNVYGLQSHPEYDAETARTIVRKKDLPEDRIEAICEGITRDRYQDSTAARAVFDNFTRITGVEKPIAAD